MPLSIKQKTNYPLVQFVFLLILLRYRVLKVCCKKDLTIYEENRSITLFIKQRATSSFSSLYNRKYIIILKHKTQGIILRSHLYALKNTKKNFSSQTFHAVTPALSPSHGDYLNIPHSSGHHALYRWERPPSPQSNPHKQDRSCHDSSYPATLS